VPGAEARDDAVAGVPLERAAGLAVEEDRGAEVLGVGGELGDQLVGDRIR
jgi:hypothetical protein